VLQIGALLARPEAAPTSGGDGNLTILAVGDSWVAGAEADPGDGFVEALADALPAAGVPARVVNRGRSGANSAHVALTVWDEAEELGADIILVLVGQNNSTNFARVADLEDRIAARDRGRAKAGPRVQVRTLKLARLIWANLRGGEGYSAQLASAPLPPIPAMEFDNEGVPLWSEPLLDTRSGEAYAMRILDGPIQADSPLDEAAFSVLFAAARREPPSKHDLTVLAGPDAQGSVLARYALLRHARETEHWRDVQSHGAALAALTPRGTLTDLGAAEDALLRGDWRSARALLTAAAHRTPGFADVQDFACRFPPEAADLAVQEACEFTPRSPSPLNLARIADGSLDPDGGARWRTQWLQRAPHDLASRADAALWLAHTGDIAGADALMGYAGPTDEPLPVPVRPEPGHWRYRLLRNAELGDPTIALTGADDALAALSTGPPDAALLGAIAQVLSEFAQCDRLLEVTERWYRVRGDAAGAARLLGACVSPADAARSVAGWRAAWDPSPAPSSFEALARAGNRSLASLERDLDLVHEEARRIGAELVLLDYPNPSDDHAALAQLMDEYAASRGVARIRLRDAFAATLSEAEWRSELGPNGHCNGTGYARMASLVQDHLQGMPQIQEITQ